MVLVAAVLALGCGGGGGTTGTTGNVTCGPTFLTPNYVQAVDPADNTQNDLRIWFDFPVRVYIENEITLQDGGTEYNTTDSTNIAIQRWIDASETAGIITLTNNPSAAEITVFFDEVSTPPSGGGILATTSIVFFPSRGELVSAEITVNIWPNMTVEEFSEGLIQTITHEFGHALFLQGHSPVQPDTMYFQSNPSVDAPLTQRDINSFLTAYCGDFTDRSVTRSIPGEIPVKQTTICKIDQCSLIRHEHTP